MKDLIIRATIEVQEENLAEFQKEAAAVLAELEAKPLETDEDFAIAKKDASDCKLIEQRIDQAIHNIKTGGLGRVSELLEIAEDWKEKFRQFRLDRSKKITNEEANRKAELLSKYKSAFNKFLAESPVNGVYRYDLKSFDVCVKGKRTLKTFEEACVAELKRYKEDINQAADRYTVNLSLIVESEKEFPGLYHDKNQLALRPAGEVEAVITSRVNDYKLKMLEKEQAKQKQPEPVVHERNQPAADPVQQQSPSPAPDFKPPKINLPGEKLPPAPDIPPPVFDPGETEHTIMVMFSGSISSARSFAESISKQDGVVAAGVVGDMPQFEN